MEFFNVRVGDLELRSCGDHLLDREPHTTAEIVQWGEAHAEIQPSCWVLAYWAVSKDGYDLKFVGDRPFGERVDTEVFMNLAKIGQSLLGILSEKGE